MELPPHPRLQASISFPVLSPAADLITETQPPVGYFSLSSPPSLPPRKGGSLVPGFSPGATCLWMNLALRLDRFPDSDVDLLCGLRAAVRFQRRSLDAT